MKGPGGEIYPMSGQVIEAIAPERLVFTAWPVKDGAAPFKNRNTVTFAQEGPATLMTLEVTVVAVYDAIAPMYLGGMEQGWSESLYRLGELVG